MTEKQIRSYRICSHEIVFFATAWHQTSCTAIQGRAIQLLKTCVHNLLCVLISNCTFEPGTSFMAKIYLSTGSNQGDRLMLLVAAAKYISKMVGRVDQFSQVIESEPWGFEAETTFYNQVLVVETALAPREVLEQVLKIEQILGRERSGNGYSSRTIDIDILFFDSELINEPDFVVPHPGLHKRRFVLFPLAEVAPELIHPVFKVPVAKLLERLHDESRITAAVDKDEFARLLNL